MGIRVFLFLLNFVISKNLANFSPKLSKCFWIHTRKKKLQKFPNFCRRNHKSCQEKIHVCPLPTHWQNRTDKFYMNPSWLHECDIFLFKESLLLRLWPRPVWQKCPISSDKGGNFCPFWQLFGQQFSGRTSSRTWFIHQPSTTVCHSYWLVSEYWCYIAAKFFATKKDILKRFCQYLRPTMNTCPCPFHLVHFVASASKFICYDTLTLTTSIWLILLCSTLWGNLISDKIPHEWGNLGNLTYL